MDRQETDNLRKTLDAIEASLEKMLLGRPIEHVQPCRDDAQLSRIAEYVNALADNYAEMARFARDVASGRLETDVPGRRNYAAAPLKELHSQLMGFVWTVQELEKGHIVGRQDYMGEVSSSLNRLIGRVSGGDGSVAEDPAKASVNSWQYHQMLMVLNHLEQMVVLVDKEYRVLFQNQKAISSMGKIETLAAPTETEGLLLEHALHVHSSEMNPFPFYTEVCDEERGEWYKITSELMRYPQGETVFLHTVDNISEWKANMTELERSATVDPLTGVYNRSFAIKALESVVQNKEQMVSCLAFVDIDGLKHINDAFGHGEGDYVIQTIAGAFTSSLRESDTVSRFGGDEFLIVFSGCKIEVAEKIIERITEKLLGINKKSKKPYTLSFSYGITQIDKQSLVSVRELIQLTDKKMYERKRVKKAELFRE